jgi:hypothetical protein
MDETLLAYHHAAHAVAMSALGYGVGRCTIGQHGTAPVTESARDIPQPAGLRDHAWRYVVEQTGMSLLAGPVAETMLRPHSDAAQSNDDHVYLHEVMRKIEPDDTVRTAWCSYIWQRTWALLASPPERWIYVCALAQALLRHRTLEGAQVDMYLAGIADALQRHGLRDDELIAEGASVPPPWHRRWFENATAALPRPAPTHVPEVLRAIRPDVRPVLTALGALSGRARNCLEKAGIVTATDLRDWSERALGMIKGAGTQTVAEIVAAARKAKIPLAPDRTYPWQIRPGRWP